jgi:competence protein ComEA
MPCQESGSGGCAGGVDNANRRAAEVARFGEASVRAEGSAMSQPPPFVLPPDGPVSRVRALLAGAGRQRIAVALLALGALLAAGVVWVRATPHLSGPATGRDAATSAAQTLPRVAPAGSGEAGSDGAGAGVGGSAVAGADGAAGAGTAGSGAAGDDGLVAVHVAGRVRRPGLVRLPAGSRVQDAIRAAGGSTSGADLDAVNLARRLTDGEQVLVPGPGDPPLPPPPGAGPDAGATPSAPLDLNTATLEQLDTLPGVGEVTAGRIIAYRSAHPFTAVDELLEVPGIGQRRFDQLKDLVTVA